MGQRKALNNKLLTICPNVYFQPPETVKLSYPCIIYELSSYMPRYADNVLYHSKDRYTVTAIYREPDDDLPREVANLPLCRSDRVFTNDNLYHHVFTLYY